MTLYKGALQIAFIICFLASLYIAAPFFDEYNMAINALGVFVVVVLMGAAWLLLQVLDIYAEPRVQNFYVRRNYLKIENLYTTWECEQPLDEIRRARFGAVSSAGLRMAYYSDEKKLFVMSEPGYGVLGCTHVHMRDADKLKEILQAA